MGMATLTNPETALLDFIKIGGHAIKAKRILDAAIRECEADDANPNSTARHPYKWDLISARDIADAMITLHRTARSSIEAYAPGVSTDETTCSECGDETESSYGTHEVHNPSVSGPEFIDENIIERHCSNCGEVRTEPVL